MNPLETECVGAVIGKRKGGPEVKYYALPVTCSKDDPFLFCKEVTFSFESRTTPQHSHFSRDMMSVHRVGWVGSIVLVSLGDRERMSIDTPEASLANWNG
ncbi:hypothetical protein TNCV_4429591 [Trichonephila clavipes]|nr:hypothetical protein TNCV_4429591 [Trichonephila clavipes]